MLARTSALWIITHSICTQGKDSHWRELTCPRKWLKTHPLCDYGKALAPMTGLVPPERNSVNCHAKTTWQWRLYLLKIIRPTTSLNAGTKWQLQKLEVGQNKVSYLPINDLTLPLEKSSASDVCFHKIYVNWYKQ